MIKLDEILNEWSNDKLVNEEAAHNDLIRIPVLHGKYLEYLSKHRIASHKAKFDYVKMKKLRREYYLGNLDKETLDEYGWEPFQYKVLRNDLKTYTDSDPDIKKIRSRIEYFEIVLEYLKSIIEQINKRNFSIKAAIDWKRFTAGEM